MTDQNAVDSFLKQRTLAVVGVSKDRKKYGNIVYRNLKDKGYQVFPVNPGIDRVEGEPCYPSLKELPEKVGGAVLVVPPAVTEQVVKEAYEAGIKHVWMQPGAESKGAVEYCRKTHV